ncbi:hypothetical protein ACFLTV_02245 [Chloroflexota bacterium]
MNNNYDRRAPEKDVEKNLNSKHNKNPYPRKDAERITRLYEQWARICDWTQKEFEG